MEKDLLFNENIKGVAYWCLERDREKLIFDENIFPKDGLFDLVRGPNTNEQFKKIANEMKVLVSGVVKAKQNCFIDSGIELSSCVLGGRVLAFSPFFTCCDGIAASESEGLLDETNQPLKAFWVGLSVDLDSIEQMNLWESNRLDSVFLISWIPEKYIDIVDYAISENGDESLYWLS